MPIRALTDAHDRGDARGLRRARHRAARRTSRAPPTTCRRCCDMIGTLEDKGLAYRADNGDVNYAVRKFPGYGKLSGKSLDELRAGERVAVLDGKEDPLDFVLWKIGQARASRPTRMGQRLRPRAAPAGTSSARRWPARCWARPSTSTAAAWTCSSRTTRTRSRRAKARSGKPFVKLLDAQRLRATSTTRRCRSRSATSSPSATC